MHNNKQKSDVSKKISGIHKIINMRGTVVAILIFFLFQGLSAQETEGTQATQATEKTQEQPKKQTVKKKRTLPDEDLDAQFQYVITKTERFQDYQVVKRTLLYKLKANTLDSIKTLKSEIVSLNKKVSELNQKLDNQQKELTEAQEKLNTITREKDSLRLLGMLVTKSAFYIIVLTIIIGLIIALLIVFILYKRSNVITVKTKETLATTQEEFEKHRKWALEKEQKLARELLKEKQKNKGIL